MEGLGSFEAWCSCASGNSTTSSSLFDGACGPRNLARLFCFSYESATYSIRWGHRLAGFEPPKEHPLAPEEAGEACSTQAAIVPRCDR